MVEINVLVVGGAGYVGSHCAMALKSAGFTPVVYDNLSTGHREFVRWGPLVTGDILDTEKLQNVISEFRPVAVLHFAALALVGESVTEPAKYWRVNLSGTLSLLDAMRGAGLDKLVFSSTCAIYGQPETVPIREDVPKAPVNPYGASKLAAERLMDDFGSAHGLRSVRLRYFNASGADPSRLIGEDRQIETHLIPLTLDAALGRRSAISIFGTDYPTADGTAVRDFVHVNDLADAHVRALRYLMDGGKTEELNLGSGEGSTVEQVIAAAERAVGRPIPRILRERRAGDPTVLVANADKARNLLQWRPRQSSLSQILTDAWAWHLSRFSNLN